MQYRFRPELPYRPQSGCDPAKIQHRAACRPQHHEGSQFSVSPAQQKQEHSRSRRHTVHTVQQGSSPGQMFPKRSQHIIGHGKGSPQQDGLQKDGQLL